MEILQPKPHGLVILRNIAVIVTRNLFSSHYSFLMICIRKQRACETFLPFKWNFRSSDSSFFSRGYKISINKDLRALL